MSRVGASLLAALWVATAPSLAHAAEEVELSSALDRDEIGLEDVVRLEITVTLSSKGETGELQLPPFRDFDVVGRAQSEQVSFAFSGSAPTFRRTTVYAISLTPHRAGTLALETVKFIYKGHTYVTNAQSVRVLPAGLSPSPRHGRGGRRTADPTAPAEPPLSEPTSDPFEGARAGTAVHGQQDGRSRGPARGSAAHADPHAPAAREPEGRHRPGERHSIVRRWITGRMVDEYRYPVET